MDYVYKKRLEGVSPHELAKELYGEVNRKTLQRIYNLFLKAKKKYGIPRNVIWDDRTGEAIDVDTGEVITAVNLEENPFIKHSKLVHHQAPFLGAYRNIRQLKSSLNRIDEEAENIMEKVDDILGHLGLAHESIIRQEAINLIYRSREKLSKLVIESKKGTKGKLRTAIAVTAVILSYLIHNPAEVQNVIETVDFLREFEHGFKWSDVAEVSQLFDLTPELSARLISSVLMYIINK